MQQVRRATAKDREQFHALWRLLFQDSQAFTTWLFQERFVPEYCFCVEEDGVLVSCMQAYPLPVFVRNKWIPSALLCGICTHPDHQKKGHMSRMLRFCMQALYHDGFLLAPHTPAVLPSYFSYGHFPVSDAYLITTSNIPFASIQATESIQTEPDLSLLYPCYRRFFQRHSGSIARSFPDFLQKASDYRTDGGTWIVYQENGIIQGYAFFYLTDTALQAIEVVADTPAGYPPLLEALRTLADGRAFWAKLPPEAAEMFPEATGSITPKGVAGAIHLPGLLASLGKPSNCVIEVFDPIQPNNNGCFDTLGNFSDLAPSVRISAGHMIQLLLGYRSLSELTDEGHAGILNAERAEVLADIFPKTACYIVDEY